MFTHEKKNINVNAHREKKNLKFQSKLEIKISVEKIHDLHSNERII